MLASCFCFNTFPWITRFNFPDSMCLFLCPHFFPSKCCNSHNVALLIWFFIRMQLNLSVILSTDRHLIETITKKKTLLHFFSIFQNFSVKSTMKVRVSFIGCWCAINRFVWLPQLNWHMVNIRFGSYKIDHS